VRPPSPELKKERKFSWTSFRKKKLFNSKRESTLLCCEGTFFTAKCDVTNRQVIALHRAVEVSPASQRRAGEI
jgi:hypothetical protein